jgi:serine/threonine-protein kinase
MGIVYLGRLEGAAGFSKPVVIKTVIPDAKDTRAAQLFVREARILSNLEHPAIVGVLDFGEVDGEYIMVLEYVHGFHLGLWARYVAQTRGEMPVSHAIEVMLPMLEALEFAHCLIRADGTPLGIVHRDVSPANILIDQSGHVKLHDFGIARMADDEFKTQDGTFRGTLSFTAPETLQGEAASARSDLYACGVILYQLIAGSNPFRGDAPSETLHRVVTHVPPRLGTLRKDVPAAIDEAVSRSMEKDPRQRYESAEAFAVALRAGRTWSAQEGASELAHAIQRDFSNPEMAKVLGVEALSTRDSAWRASQPPRGRTPLGSSRPPASEANDPSNQTAKVDRYAEPPTMQALPSHALLQLARDGERVAESEPSKSDEPSAAEPPPLAAQTSSQSSSPKRRSPLGVAILSGLAVAVLGGGAFALLHRETPAAPRFLLIEKQADAEPEANAATSALAAASVAPASAAAASTQAAAAPQAATKVTHATETPASGSTITAAFQRQRGRVEACFRANQGETSTPQLTLRFQIEASGAVRSTELSPAAIAGSPLGACILGVARSTRFPSGEAPISFTIPITAHKTGG